MDYLDAIRRESDLFYATADKAEPTLGVPSCPGWDVGDLVWHLGEVHWFWATAIEIRATDPEQIEKDKPQRPSEYRELVAWGRSQVDHLFSALEANADDVPVWTWALDEKDHTVGFIRRHQVQEAAVHRWDLQSAASTNAPTPIDPEAASDSIDEFMSISLPWCINAKKPLPGTVHLHCTDTAGEWFVHPDGRVEAIHAKGDVALRATAADLLLLLYSRVGLDAIEVIGDESLGQQFVGAIEVG
jgi:uncharacterized protein (TIGR03083 family)